MRKMKKIHRVFAGILVGVISIAMVASYFAMYFGSSSLPSNNSNTTTNLPNTAAEYQASKARLAEIAARAKADPGNIQLQNDLGNEYYDAGVAAQSVAPSEAPGNFKHAVEAYQTVLKTNKDPNTMIDMAIAAFYSGNNDLAEKTFQEALALKPDFYNGLANYGIYLSEAKQDLPGAIAQWQKAENVAPDSTEKERMAALISQAQSQLKAPAGNAPSNPNPALQNKATQPVPPSK